MSEPQTNEDIPPPPTLASLYSGLLTVGFINLREALAHKDHDWIAAEIELLHDIPRLIGEEDFFQHERFLEENVSSYFEWVSAPGRENQRARATAF